MLLPELSDLRLILTLLAMFANILKPIGSRLVLDNWELENVFDAEFGHGNGLGKTRRETIRREHKAFWSTGQSPGAVVSPGAVAISKTPHTSSM